MGDSATAAAYLNDDLDFDRFLAEADEIRRMSAGPGMVQAPPPLADFTQDLAGIAAQQTQEAIDMLSIDFSREPDWFSPKLTAQVGPLLEADFIIVGARPGGGKTTLLSAQTRHMVQERGAKVIYAGTEMKPARLKITLACSDLGLDAAAVLRGQWDQLPVGSRSRMIQRVQEYEHMRDSLVFVPDERISLATVENWCRYAERHGFSVLVIDHLHRMDWGTTTELTAAMTEGMRHIKTLARRHGLRIIAAAQLRRGHYDPLEDYLVPPQSAIKQSGAAEEEADLILMLHRALREDATEGDLQLVRRGQRPISDVAEFGTMAIHIAKSRLDGTVRDTEVRLYVGKGQLFDQAHDRDLHLFRHPLQAQPHAHLQLVDPRPSRHQEDRPGHWETKGRDAVHPAKISSEDLGGGSDPAAQIPMEGFAPAAGKPADPGDGLPPGAPGGSHELPGSSP